MIYLSIHVPAACSYLLPLRGALKVACGDSTTALKLPRASPGPTYSYLAASRGTLFPALKHIYLHIPNKQHTRLKDTRGLNGAYTTIELLIDTQYGSLSRRAQTWPAPAHRRQ
jgi:hypothetical protein